MQKSVDSLVRQEKTSCHFREDESTIPIWLGPLGIIGFLKFP
jgi:hypothetical protein